MTKKESTIGKTFRGFTFLIVWNKFAIKFM